MEKTAPRTRRRPKTKNYNLTQRDLQLLAAIHDFGGVLTTVQISTLLWPPDVARRLAGWGVPGADTANWVESYPAAYLADKVEQLKWGLRINRVREKAKRSKAELKLFEWIAALEPLIQEELRGWLDSLAAMQPAEWLRSAVAQDKQPPHAFILRLRLPSEAVSSACKNRLRHLTQLGLVELYDRPARRAEGRAQACWFLTREGRNVLARARNVKPNSMDWKRPGSYGTLHLTHRLLINEFRIALLLACKQRGYHIRRWIDDNQLKRMLGKEKVQLFRLTHDPKTGAALESEEEHTLRIPDGFFWLDMGAAGERHCFFELENQTLTLNYTDPNPKDFAHKLRTLSAYYRSGRYKERFPEAGDSMWLLTVSTGSEQRLANLHRTAERVVGTRNRALDRYWFARLDDFPTWQDPFTTAAFENVWLRGGSTEKWSLDGDQR